MRIATLYVIGAFLVALYATLVARSVSRELHSLLETGTSLEPENKNSSYPRMCCDVAVVLGYALDRQGQPSFTLQRRVDRGLELFKEGAVSHVLFSGGHDGQGLHGRPSEAESMLQYALMSEDMPSPGDPWWLLEEGSTSTRTNAVLSLEILYERNMHSLALVTSEFHQFRAGRTFRVAAQELAMERGDLTPIVVNVVDVSSIPWSPNGNKAHAFLRDELLNQFNFLRELAAIIYYTARGWI